MKPLIRSYPQAGRKMLFVLPPVDNSGTAVTPSHHPIMTATMVAQAIAEGAYVGVIDAALLGVSQQHLVDCILSWGAEWIGFVPFEYRREMPLQQTLSVISGLKEQGCSAQIGVLNASWGSLPPRRAVEKGEIDFVAFGDSEPAVQKFATGPSTPPDGVLWNIHGYLEEGTRRPSVPWDSLPVPAWLLFDYNTYAPSAHRYRYTPTLPVFASRACPYGCDFCPQSLFNPSQKHSSRSVQSVFSEIQVLISHYGVKDIEFYDPTFGIRREETLELCRLLEREGIVWSCYTRCDILDAELVEAMARSGCHTILFGVESADEDIRGRTNKELSRSAIEHAFMLCEKHNIQTIASFIIGLPKETPNSLRRTISFACSLNPTYAQFHLARSFFDHEEWSRHGRVLQDWNVTDASVNGQAYIPHGFSQKSLERWLLRSYAQFYGRPSKIWELSRVIRSPQDLRRYSKGVLQILGHVLS